MKFLKIIIIFSIDLVVSSCGFSKENNKNLDIENKSIFNGIVTREKVLKYKF